MAGEKIIKFLDKKKAQGFTGCVKMVFEEGRLSLVSEANHLDFPMTKVFSQKTVSDLAAMTGEKGFSGALVFSFNHGAIEFYSYMRSFKGDALSAILGDESKGGKRK